MKTKKLFGMISAIIFVSFFFSLPLFSQWGNKSGYDYLRLSGPRLGVTYIMGESAQTLEERYDAVPFVSQFGWQFEGRFFTLENGTAGLIEAGILVGGLEQGLFLPSVSGIIGIRSGSGLELGVGPNLSLSGFSLAIITGFTISTGGVNFPINFALVPSNKGVRFSVLFGFNAAR